MITGSNRDIEPPHIKCSICMDDGLCSNNIFSKNYDKGFSDYLDCMLYIRKRKSLMRNLLSLLKSYLPILFISFGLSTSPQLSFGSQSNFKIKMLNERGYEMKVRGDVYTVKVSPSHQTIFKMVGFVPSNKMERITWSINKKYWWGDGMGNTDTYPLVNKVSYSKLYDGENLCYSLVGFLPEMRNSSVVIYGHYGDETDSIKVFIR